MFKKLTDFGHKRNFVQAIGFYLAYLLLIALIGALLGAMSGALSETTVDAFNLGIQMGLIVAVALSITLCILIIKSKKLQNNFLYILLTIVAGILAIFLGGLGGLIVPAFLSTRKKGRK